MTTTISFEVSYGQLAVFASSLSQPFNDWTDQHFAQGFAWRPGSVSFRTVSDAGIHVVDIEVVDRLNALGPDVLRAIDVPFEVPIDGKIEVGSISETVPLVLPVGSFMLRCEFMRSPSEDCNLVRLAFAKFEVKRFAVVRSDLGLVRSEELLLTRCTETVFS